MGMDVSGKEPLNEKGEYFRNNVWWWRPLWNYCLEVAPAIAGQVEHGHTNDGDGLGARDSFALAAVLRDELSSGRTAEYQKRYMKRLAELPDEPCNICHGTGDRPGWVTRNNRGERIFTDAWAKECNGCNACLGKGSKRPFEANYPFSVENVERFTTFLENCGGFEIY